MAKQGTYPRGNRMTAPKRRIVNKRRGPLAAWLKKNDKSLTEAAKQFGVSVQHISNVVHGHTKPSRELAVVIEQHTGIGAGEW